jgi:hypothetical protein
MVGLNGPHPNPSPCAQGEGLFAAWKVAWLSEDVEGVEDAEDLGRGILGDTYPRIDREVT